uniref:PAP-associated domain-containing protein n=1 Tax=Clastoptera arizonana TaxID=38151 RepID=A0A1B6CKY0_9HEMI
MTWTRYFNILNFPCRCPLEKNHSNNSKKILYLRYLQFLFNYQPVRGYVHSGTKIEPDDHHKVINFDTMLKIRRDEARRSILVQVQSEQSCPDVHNYCLQFGQIKNLYFYSHQETSHFTLIEFPEASCVDKVLQECGHIDLSRVIPVRSPFLWFRSGMKNTSTNIRNNKSSVNCKKGKTKPRNNELIEWLMQAETISDQMLILYKSTCLDDLAIRLRFLTARQVEASITGLFPVNKCLLFGSSVNGFGILGCDLDLFINFDDSGQESYKKRLVFHTKSSLLNNRTQVQKHLEALADHFQLFHPGCTSVKRIFQAKVPIMKYRQELTGIDCDLSISSMTAIYMSELLYTFGNIDWRIRPLMFTIKKWAAEVKLTNPNPGRYITNFSISLLVIFYLQQIKILPSLDELIKKSGVDDKRLSDDGVNCTFLRDVTSFQRHPRDKDLSLEDLLQGFFEYYASFDFNMKAIALGCGGPLPKQDYAPLYIINPLERHLNVSKNVSAEETERLKIELRNAMWELELSSKSEENNREGVWGLMRLFQGNNYSKREKDLFSLTRKTVLLNSEMSAINKNEKLNSSIESQTNTTTLKGRRR